MTGMLWHSASRVVTGPSTRATVTMGAFSSLFPLGGVWEVRAIPTNTAGRPRYRWPSDY